MNCFFMISSINSSMNTTHKNVTQKSFLPLAKITNKQSSSHAKKCFILKSLIECFVIIFFCKVMVGFLTELFFLPSKLNYDLLQ